MLPGWAVVTTKPRAEAKAVADITKMGYEVFYPKLIRRVRKQGKRVQMICPLFPGYFFVWLQQHYSQLLGVNGVNGLLLDNEQVATVHGDIMKELRAQCNRNGIYIEPPVARFKYGQKVKPTWGAFIGMVGIFDKVRTQQEIALFNLFGSKTPVAFDKGNLAPA